MSLYSNSDDNRQDGAARGGISSLPACNRIEDHTKSGMKFLNYIYRASTGSKKFLVK